MNDHKRFEILCALVVVGQAGDADLRELKRHVEGCGACQNRISDFAQISAQMLPLSGDKYSQPRRPTAMTGRFVERARAQGIPLREPHQLLPSELSFALSWKGSLAAALLFIAIVAGGILRYIASRAPSPATIQTATVEIPAEPSVHTKSTQARSTRPRTNPLPVPRQSKTSNVGSANSLHAPTRLNSEQVFHGVAYSANHDPGNTAFNSQVFLRDVRSEHPRRIQTDDRNSGRPWFDLSFLMPSAERNPLANAADSMATNPGERTAFAAISLNFPPSVFSFACGRPFQSDPPRNRSELIPNIDWYQVWLVRTESLRTSNRSPAFHPVVLAPVWPFTQESKGDQR
jgi:hypothetical protein